MSDIQEPVMVKAQDLLGGDWLATMREFIQWRAIRGDAHIWGTDELVTFSSITVKDLEKLAARIAALAINEDRKRAYRDARFQEALRQGSRTVEPELHRND